MPVYKYKCPFCGIVREVKHRMDESPEVMCSSCIGGSSRKMEKQFISPNIIIRNPAVQGGTNE